MFFDNAWYYHYVIQDNIVNNSLDPVVFDPEKAVLKEYRDENLYKTWNVPSANEVQRDIIGRKQTDTV